MMRARLLMMMAITLLPLPAASGLQAQSLEALDIEAGYCIGAITTNVEITSAALRKLYDDHKVEVEKMRREGVNMDPLPPVDMSFNEEKKWVSDFQIYLKMRNAVTPGSASLRIAVAAIKKGEADAVYCQNDYQSRYKACQASCGVQDYSRKWFNCITETCSVDRVKEQATSCVKPNACRTLSTRLPM